MTNLQFRFGETVVRISNGKEYRITELDPEMPYPYKITPNTKSDLSSVSSGGVWVREDMIRKII